MKQLTFILLILLFCFLNFKKQNPKLFYPAPTALTTLDSLQGNWVNDDDSANKILIHNNDWIDYRTDGNTILNSQRYQIYFSDTVINTIKITTPIFDSLQKNGRYILYKSLQDTTYDCQFIGGFFYEANDTFVVFEPKLGFPKGNTAFLYKKIH